jgi:hypothetical protein
MKNEKEKDEVKGGMNKGGYYYDARILVFG